MFDTGKICILVTVLIITFALSNATSTGTSTVKKFAYSGPDGCTDNTCDCTEETSVESDSDGNIVSTVLTLICQEYNHTTWMQIPSIFQNAVTNLAQTTQAMFLKVTEGSNPDNWISPREIFGMVYYFFVKRILGQDHTSEDNMTTKENDSEQEQIEDES